MLARKPIFPNVIEMNFQAGEVLGCCVYLVFDGSDWVLIDIGLEDTVEEIVELRVVTVVNSSGQFWISRFLVSPINKAGKAIDKLHQHLGLQKLNRTDVVTVIPV